MSPSSSPHHDPSNRPFAHDAGPQTSEASLCYEPYLCLGVLLKTPEVVRTARPSAKSPPARISGLSLAVERFQKRLAEYREHRKRAAKAWAQTEDVPDGWLDPWLYRPLSMTCLGFLDEICFVLVDTPDSYFRVFTQEGLPITQVSLAAVPTCQSLKIPVQSLSETIEGTSSWPEWLSAHSLVSSPLAPWVPERPPFVRLQELFSSRTDPKRHPYREDSPLVAFSRMRLGSLAALGGNSFRSVFYQALACKIAETQIALLRELESPGQDGEGRRKFQKLLRRFFPGRKDMRPKDVLKQLGITRAVVTSLTVSFMDTLGVEEVGLLISSRNYSLTMCIHAAIQGLRFLDLGRPPLEGVWKSERDSQERMHRVIREILKADNISHPGETRPAAESDLLNDNHLVSITHTTLGVLSEVWDAIGRVAIQEVGLVSDAKPPHPASEVKPKPSQAAIDVQALSDNITGQVEAYVRAGKVSSGHAVEVESRMRNYISHFRKKAAPIDKHLVWDAQIHRVLLGRHDLDWSACWTERQPLTMIKTLSLLKLCGYIERQVSVGEEGLAPFGPVKETGLSELATAVVVPVPRWGSEKEFPQPVQAPDHQPLMEALEQLGLGLFGKADHPGQRAPFSSVHRATKDLRFPIRLQRIIETLYTLYQKAIQDPILFDHVLDISDCYRALQVHLSHDLPRMLGEAMHAQWANLPPDPSEQDLLAFLDRCWDGVLDDATIAGLGEYCDSLANALDHRIYFESQLEYAEWSASPIRGGLVQLVHANGAALRASAGLQRFAWETDFGERRHRMPTGRQVGLVARYTLHERAESLLVFRETANRANLDVLTLEIGHLINPCESERYFHEVAHSILYNWSDRDGKLPFHGPESPIGPNILDRRLRALAEAIVREPDSRMQELDRGELFAIALTQVFIYGDDWQSGQAYRIACYSSSHRSGHPSLERAVYGFLSFLLDSYMGVSALIQRGLSPDKAADDPTAKSQAMASLSEIHPWFTFPKLFASENYLTETIIEKILPAFMEYCETVGPICFHYAEFRKWITAIHKYGVDYLRGDHIEGEGSRQFEQLVDLVRQIRERLILLQDVWWRVVKLYDAYFKSFWPNFDADDMMRLEWLIRGSLDNREASLSRILEQFEKQLPKEKSLPKTVDDLMIITRLIKILVQFRVKQIEELAKRYHRPAYELWESHEERRPAPLANAPIPELLKKYFTNPGPLKGHALVANAADSIKWDRRYTRPFAIEGADGTDLMGQEITALRILWDISCRQRARRLIRMFREVLDSSAEQTWTPENEPNPLDILTSPGCQSL